MPVDFARFDVLTFDCYGTLIDWEAGLAAALREALPDLRGVADEELLEEYASREAEAEQGSYRTYRQVLAQGLRGVDGAHALAVTDDVAARFSESVRRWPAFPDSAEALARLRSRFRLGVITNCDTDLFLASSERLGVVFDWVVTAEMAGAYKPSRRNFELAFDMIGMPRGRILHVAQSLYHEHVTAQQLGMTPVWIDRRQARPGFGATPPAEATPDATFPDLASFADAAS